MKQDGSRRPEAVRVGQAIVLAQPNQEALHHAQERALARGYQVFETPHFTVYRRSPSTSPVVMHTFRQDEIDAELICFTQRELSSLNLMASEKDFAGLLFAVLASPFSAPRDQRLIWRRFCENSLRRLRVLLTGTPERQWTGISHLVPFAAVYHRVFELFVGKSLLDVGSCFGFLPLLMAERMPEGEIVGCDKNVDMLAIARDLAQVDQPPSSRVRFVLDDVLSEQFLHQGRYDTVTAIHLLEHLPEPVLPLAFEHLLGVTARRLVIAVPFEESAQPLYGHVQVFTSQKLHFWGNWCIDRLEGVGKYWYEEVMGGMLIIERFS